MPMTSTTIEARAKAPIWIHLPRFAQGTVASLVRPAVEQEGQEGREDDEVDRGVLGAHDAEVAEDLVEGPPHLVDLGRGQDEGLRRGPDQDAQGDDPQEVLDPAAITLGAVDAVHGEPEVVVGRQEEGSDQHRLHDEEPGQHPAHHVNAELLVVDVDLEAEVVAGKGERAGAPGWR